MIASAASISASNAALTPRTDPETAPAHRPSLFHQFLSELNPLQYLPVIGTIYRAVTGDTIPQAARLVGSLVVSGLTGGPIGIAMNLGATAAEHLLGVDPEKTGTRLLAELGIGHAPGASSPAQRTVLAATSPISPPQTAGSSPPVLHSASSVAITTTGLPQHVAQAWSFAQLAAYGVRSGGTGELTRGILSGADVLNGLELARLNGGNAIV